MVGELTIKVDKIDQSRINQLDLDNVQFGKLYSDHMFKAVYNKDGWGQFNILPYGNISVSPANQALHYGVSVFEGMKAYKHADGSVALFRPRDNWKRINKSAARLCMAELPEEVFMEGLTNLLKLDSAWVPDRDGFSLYIRPFMFSSEEYIGIKTSEYFNFMIITSPVGSYYSQAVKVKIEMEYARAVKGGTGYAKAAGNYAGALYPTKLATKEGYQQIIWTDGREHKYIEEAGTMNLIFEIDGKIVTPELTDTFLPGITRDSVLQISRHLGYETVERKVTVDEIVTALKEGRLNDAFGVGTAATVTHLSHIGFEGVDYELPPVPSREKSNRIKSMLDDIKTGKIEDPFGWMVKI